MCVFVVCGAERRLRGAPGSGRVGRKKESAVRHATPPHDSLLALPPFPSPLTFRLERTVVRRFQLTLDLFSSPRRHATPPPASSDPVLPTHSPRTRPKTKQRPSAWRACVRAGGRLVQKLRDWGAQNTQKNKDVKVHSHFFFFRIRRIHPNSCHDSDSFARGCRTGGKLLEAGAKKVAGAVGTFSHQGNFSRMGGKAAVRRLHASQLLREQHGHHRDCGLEKKGGKRGEEGINP